MATDTTEAPATTGQSNDGPEGEAAAVSWVTAWESGAAFLEDLESAALCNSDGPLALAMLEFRDAVTRTRGTDAGHLAICITQVARMMSGYLTRGIESYDGARAGSAEERAAIRANAETLTWCGKLGEILWRAVNTLDADEIEKRSGELHAEACKHLALSRKKHEESERLLTEAREKREAASLDDEIVASEAGDR